MTDINTWTQQVFVKALYAYKKEDLASLQRPGIFVLPLPAEKHSDSYRYTGRIRMELYFNLKHYRTDLAQNVIQIATLIELMNLNMLFQRHLQDNMNGVVWFGKHSKKDLTQVWDKHAIGVLEFDYHIDLQAYVAQLNAQGFGPNSPDEQIYFNALKLQEEIALLDQNGDVVIIT